MTGRSKLLNSIRNKPLSSGAALVVGLLFGMSAPAHAQMAFQGVPTVQSGGADINSNAFVDSISVFTDQVVIDWLPDDMAINGADIDFLPAGTTAIYESNLGGPANFTVLNRIVPVDNTRPIILNGDIISRIEVGSGVFDPGGSVWFYAPGGIVIGGTAVIDVGGLFLTTADPIVDGMGEFIDVGGTTNFAPAISGTFAEIDAGASITLTPENSYVGLLAPIVTQSGDVDVNGSAAYIAAEQASITFNQGLFDINVTIGTDGDIPIGVALRHDGVTAGPASSGVGDNHRVYAVAVPKNNAISIAIQNGGDIGFDIAGAVDVVGNAVILSAGHNVAGDVIANTPVNGIDASIEIENNSFTSAVTGRASHNITTTATAGAMAFASNLTLQADDLVDVMAFGPGSAITVDGITNLSADVQGVVDGEDATGGVIGILGSGGTIALNGDVMLSANGTGADNFSGLGKLGDGFGGTVEIGAEGGGSVNITGAVTMVADGIGGFSGTGVDGGNGTGGTGRLLANDGNSTVSIVGDLSISAASVGSSGNGGINDTNGNAVGGNITISGIGGTNNLIDVGGITTLATGAFGADAFSGNAGSAIGGNITVDAGSGTTLNFDGSLIAGATVLGGNSDALGSGGDATGGSVLITTSDATGIITTGADAQLASAVNGGFSSLGLSGNAQGGSGIIRSGPGSITITGPVDLNAEAFGESSSFGGSVALESSGGSLTINGNANLSANGTSGSGSDDGTGGTADISANGGTLTIGGTSFASADGFGGFNGGSGFGGTTSLLANGGGSVNLVGDAILIASGFGGDGMGVGAGSGTGGAIFAQAGANSAINVTSLLNLNVNGLGGNADSGSNGGDGIGGTVLLDANGGNATLLVGTTTAITAEGRDAPIAGFNLNGANAVGGSVTITGSGGTNNLLDLGATTINAFAEHASTSSGNGGTATGGDINVIAETGTTINFGNLNGAAFGTAGTATGIGGNAFGGAIQLAANGDNANIIVTGALDLGAQGNGRGGAGGGTGTGGGININATGGTNNLINITGGATLIADAVGGDSSNGDAGDATGGTLALSIGSASVMTIGGNTLLRGAANAGTSSGNGSGGDAFGGSADIIAAGGGDGALTGNNLSIATDATAGNSADGSNGGNVLGGTTFIRPSSSAAGGLSTVSFGDLIIDNLASAGNGGNGIAGGAGGNGGDATPGGEISLFGTAGSGVLMLGNVTINSSMVGGIGGNGGDVGSGSGGNGGGGGSVTATLVQIGSVSSIDTPDTLGSATYGNTFVTADAVAGNGGNGGTGDIIGNGGNGGEALAAALVILPRGSPVVIGDVDYTAQSVGGDGGGGATQGNGGNATGSDALIFVANRLNRTEQGSLNAGNISIFSTANAGTGAVAGTSTVGIGIIDVVQGTATIASYDAFISGDIIGAGSDPSSISVVDGTLTITNDLLLLTDSNIAVVADNGAVDVGGTLDLDTNGTFVVSPDGMAPANPGLLTVVGSTLLTSAADVILSTDVSTVSDFTTSANGDSSFGSINSGGLIDIAITGNIQAGNLTSVGDILLDATGTLTTGSLDSGGALTVSAADDVNVGNISALGTAQVASLIGNLTALAVSTGGNVVLTANNGAVTAGIIDAGANVQVDALNAVTLGAVTAGLSAQIASQTGTISGGTIDTGDDFIVAPLGTTNIDFDDVTAGGLIDIASNGALTLGAVDGGMDVVLTGTTGLDAGLVQAVGAVAIASGGLVDVQDVIAGTNVDIAVTGSSASFGNIDAATDIVIDAVGALTLANANSGGLIDIVAGGNVQTGSLTSPDDIRLDSDQSILGTGAIMTDGAFVSEALGSGSYGNISAEGVGNGGILGIAIDTAGGISTGDLSTGSAAIGLLTPAAITTGNVTSATDAIFLAGTGITAGAISTANGPDNFIYLANASMEAQFGPGGDPTPLFALDPVATSGSITINNAVSGGNLVAATAGDFVSQGNMALSTLFSVEAAGLAGFGGVLTAPTIALISSDIDIGAGGGLGDENTSELTLTNSGVSGASIGDVASGPLGYDLNNAEAGRLRANMISISSDGSGGVIIGDLDLTGSDAIGSNLVGADGALQIASTDDIRVSGNLNITDMAADNLLSLTADTISVASDTGGIVLEGNSPGGTLNLSARHIHVGSAALLEQLAIDSFFTGRNDVLARATPTGNPDGSIQAASITFAAEETLLIQNVGSGGIAYGFYAETGEVEIIPTGADDLDVFVFGATLNVDDTQVLNDDVLATVFPVAPADGFTAGSSINGCLLATAVCVNLVSEDTPIAVSVRDVVEEQPQAVEEELSEEEKEEAEEKATSKSPISRTVSIINTSPMNSTGSISEPVTSGGNPNLMGAPSSAPSDDISKVDGL